MIIGVGGQKAGLVALSLEHGKTLWESPARNVSYASCVPFRTQENKFYVLSFLRDGFSIVDADTGKESFFSPFRSSIDASVNAATPAGHGSKNLPQCMLRSRFCFVAISNEPKNKWIIEDGATLETTRIIGLSFLDAGRIPELYLRFSWPPRKGLRASLCQTIRW